jgi:CHAD domain-containing protein
MKPKKLFRQWQRRRQELQTALRTVVRQCRRHGDAEQVHELRVTLRRLRLFVRAGRPLLDERAVAHFRTWAHGVSRLSSPVRDLDVAIEWLVNEPRAATATRLCQRARDRLWLKVRPRLPPLPQGLLAAVGRITQAESEATARRLAKRVNKLERRYEAAARTALPRFFSLANEDQHEFRRTLRWWRYLRELSLPPRCCPRDRLLGSLVAAQETTGDRQNLALAMTAVRRHCQEGAATAKLRHRLQHEQVEQTAKIEKSLAALARLRKWRG